MLRECDIVALCDLSHQLIHWLPFRCYFERGTSSEWANDAHTDACACTIKRTDKDVCTPTHRPAAQSELQPRCSNLPLSSNIKKKKADNVTETVWKHSVSLVISSDIFTVIKLLRSFPQSVFLTPGWYTVNALGCSLSLARIITIEGLQYGSTDGCFYLVHRYICWLILGPTPAMVKVGIMFLFCVSGIYLLRAAFS